jgi:lactoylglutathione lyase
MSTGTGRRPYLDVDGEALTSPGVQQSPARPPVRTRLARTATDDDVSCARLQRMFASALVNLYTANIDAGLRFYRDLLGFDETFRTPTEGTPEHVELALNGFTLGLGTVQAAKKAHGVDAAPGSPAMALVVWTHDVDEAFEHLTSAGAPVVQPPHDVGNDNRNALLRDPDGNLVEIVAKVGHDRR